LPVEGRETCLAVRRVARVHDTGREQLHAVYPCRTNLACECTPFFRNLAPPRGAPYTGGPDPRSAGIMRGYEHCRRCGFALQQHEYRCSDCGAGVVRRRGAQLQRAWLILSGAALGLVAAAAARGLPDSVAIGAVLVWALLSGSAALPILVRQRRRTTSSGGHSEQTGRGLRARLIELQTAQQQLQELVQRRDREPTSAYLSQLDELLERSHTALEEIARNYRIELARVELIRWRDALGRFVSATAGAGSGFVASQARLDALETLRKRGRQLLTNWQTAGVAAEERGREAMQSMQATLASCDRLITRWITLAAQGVLDRVAAKELEPAADPEVDDALAAQATLLTSLAPDELEDVQYLLDRITATTALRS
jgi:hypothetical protein